MKQLYLGLIMAITLANIAAGQAVTKPATAAPSPMPPALTALETMVSNLGYATTTGPDNQHFSFVWSSKYNYQITFDVSGNSPLAFGYVGLTSIDAAQLAKAPFLKMLHTNDLGDCYFSTEPSSAGQTLFANIIIPLTGLTPVALRSYLEALVKELDNTDTVWNSKLWK